METKMKHPINPESKDKISVPSGGVTGAMPASPLQDRAPEGTSSPKDYKKALRKLKKEVGYKYIPSPESEVATPPETIDYDNPWKPLNYVNIPSQISGIKIDDVDAMILARLVTSFGTSDYMSRNNRGNGFMVMSTRDMAAMCKRSRTDKVRKRKNGPVAGKVRPVSQNTINLHLKSLDKSGLIVLVIGNGSNHPNRFGIRKNTELHKMALNYSISGGIRTEQDTIGRDRTTSDKIGQDRTLKEGKGKGKCKYNENDSSAFVKNIQRVLGYLEDNTSSAVTTLCAAKLSNLSRILNWADVDRVQSFVHDLWLYKTKERYVPSARDYSQVAGSVIKSGVTMEQVILKWRAYLNITEDFYADKRWDPYWFWRHWSQIHSVVTMEVPKCLEGIVTQEWLSQPKNAAVVKGLRVSYPNDVDFIARVKEISAATNVGNSYENMEI